jgi:hypothetical protein
VKTNKDLLRELRFAYDTLRSLLGTISPAALDLRPRAEFWTVREHVVHLMDATLFGFLRYRKAIAQPGAPVDVFDEEQWTARLRYQTVSVESALEIIERLLIVELEHLGGIADADWKQYSITHPERGENALPELIAITTRHIDTHRTYIERNVSLLHP